MNHLRNTVSRARLRLARDTVFLRLFFGLTKTHGRVGRGGVVRAILLAGYVGEADEQAVEGLHTVVANAFDRRLQLARLKGSQDGAVLDGPRLRHAVAPVGQGAVVGAQVPQRLDHIVQLLDAGRAPYHRVETTVPIFHLLA